MADPTISTAVRKFLSLDTPASRRIFEIALLSGLGLIVASAYVRDHFNDSTAIVFTATAMGIFGGLVLLLLIVVLVIRIFADAASKNIH